MSLSKTTTKRLLIVLSCVLLLAGIGGGAYAIRKQRVRAQFMAWREEGMRAAASGAELDKAVDLLGRYLRRYPEDVDALVEYARVRPLVKSQDRQYLRDTMLVLRHLLTLRPDMIEQRRALLRLYADFGYASEALATADKILEPPNPKDPEVLGIRATSLARMRRLDDAYKAAKDWAKFAPQDVDAHLLTAEMMRANGKPKGEIEAWAKGLEKTLTDPGSFELVRGVAAAAGGEQEQAVGWVRKAAATPGVDKKVRRRIVAALDNLGMHRESLDMLKQLVNEFGEPAEQRFLIRRLWELEAWAELLSHPIPAGSELSNDRELKAMVGTALARTGKVAEAKAIVAELSGATQDPVAVAWAAALGQILSPETTDYRKCLDACLAGLKDSPSNPYLRCFAGQAYARLGETEMAIANYQKAAQQNSTWAAPLLYMSSAYLGLGRQEQAFDAASGAFLRARGLGAVALAVAWNANVEIGRRGNDAELGALLKEIEDAAPGQFYALPERVAWLARGKRKPEAIALADRALTASPVPPDVILYRLAAVSRFYELGLEAQCYAAIEGQGGAVSPSLALSRAIAAFVSGKKDEALPQFDQARSRSGKGETLEWQIASARLLDLTRQPNVATAAAAWVALADAHPDDLTVQQLALAARTPRADREFVDRTIERVRRLCGGEGVQWRVARARWLLEKTSDRRLVDPRGIEQASVLLGEVLRVAPDAIEARFLQAKAFDLLGNASAAIEQLIVVVKLNPSLQAASLSLAQLLQARGDFTKAREYLDRVTRSSQQDQAYRQWTAQLLAKQGDPQEAIKLLTEAADQGGDSELMLATLYRQQNDLKRAEEICRKRLQATPDVGTVVLAVDVYAAMGRPPEDVKRVAALLKDLNVEPGVEELLLAEYSAKSGHLQEAIDLTRLATQRAPKNPNTWRALAISCFAAGKLPDAMAAVELGLKSNPSDPYLVPMIEAKPQLIAGMADPQLRPLAMALAQSPDAPGPREALQVMTAPRSTADPLRQQLALLKQVADRYPLNLPVQLFTTERLFAAAANERDAKRQAVKRQWQDEGVAIATRASQTFPLSADAARLAAGALMAAGRWPEVELFAKAWKNRSGAVAVEADVLLATALLKQDKAADAKQQLAGYFPKVLEDPDHNPEVITLYSIALHRTAALDEERKILVPALKSSEAVRTKWVEQSREMGGDAVELLTMLGEFANGDSLAGQVQLAGVSTALGQKTGNEALLAVARQLRAKILDRKDLSPRALAVLGSQAEEDKDLAGAEALYRRALAGDATLSVIKNNLAYVIVRRGGDRAEAMTLINDAIRSDPQVPNFYDTLARVHATGGETDKAIEAFRKAASVDPDHLIWQSNVVQALADAKRLPEASKALEELEVAAKGKIDPELKTRIEELRQRIGNQTKGPVSVGSR